MRPLVLVLLLLVGADACSAPAPFPRRKPKPVQVRGFWAIDFAPMASAGRVNLTVSITIRTADNRERRLSVGQSGAVLVAPIIDAFARSFQKGDLVINPGKTRILFKSMNGMPIVAVDLKLRNLDPRYSPVVLPPGKR